MQCAVLLSSRTKFCNKINRFYSDDFHRSLRSVGNVVTRGLCCNILRGIQLMRNLKTHGEEKGHRVVFGVEGDVDELCHEGFDNTSHKRGELT